GDIIMPKSTKKVSGHRASSATKRQPSEVSPEPEPEAVVDEEEEGDDSDVGEEEEYVVERITDHKFDGKVSNPHGGCTGSDAARLVGEPVTTRPLNNLQCAPVDIEELCQT